MKRLIFLLLTVFCFLSFVQKPVNARVGVGVNTGKIQVDEELTAGLIYKLPPITIINTGDETSEYTTSIAFHKNQPELMPKEEWFIFSPSKFTLEEGEAQLVDIKINLPLKIEPGDYFAYLEGRPLVQVKQGTTTLGVAAAAKLYFTVVSASPLHAIYYKVVSFWKIYAPWPQRAAIVVGVIVLLLLFKKFFNIKIGLKNEDKNDNHSEDTKNE